MNVPVVCAGAVVNAGDAVVADDGMGGADPLTCKVAVVRRSQRPVIEVDYLFLQVFVDQPIVTDAQTCGNILAGVGPFAIEPELRAEFTARRAKVATRA